MLEELALDEDIEWRRCCISKLGSPSVRRPSIDARTRAEEDLAFLLPPEDSRGRLLIFCLESVFVITSSQHETQEKQPGRNYLGQYVRKMNSSPSAYGMNVTE